MSTATANPLGELSALREEEDRLATVKLRLIGQARQQGASWADIGEAMGVSRQAAWEQYSAEIKAMLDRIRDRTGWTEEEAMQIAREELAAVRRERRERNKQQ